MIRDWRLRKKIAFGVIGLLFLNTAVGVFLSWQVARQFKTTLPPGSTVGSVVWSPPFGVMLEMLSIPDSSGKNPFLLQADRVTLQIPWWGLLARPFPAKVIMVRPHLKVGSENIDLLVGGLEDDPHDWVLTSFENPVLGKIPFVPFGIQVINGRVDVIEQEIRAEAPVFIADHVNLSLELTATGIEPTIHLVSKGDFVTESGELIGKQEVELRYQPRVKAIEGNLRLRHERLGDFRNLYQYAPRPIFIEGGIADFSMKFALIGGKHVKMTVHTLVQNLDLTGKVGEVSWADILHAVEDENRIYEWTVPAEGDLDDPAFSPHDHVLREVEWKMKEKAASRGLGIPEQMFFYADTPEA
ncbi:MAG: hypothetical protein Q7J69_02370 [Candidatus Omnitrophota bacterium]|nr:hypothetical protein [Candidatus Omnitrophota bacterium]